MRPWRALRIIAHTAILGLSTAVAQSGEVSVQTLAEDPLRGNLVRWSLTGGMVLETAGGTEPLRLAGDEIVRVAPLGPRRGTVKPESPQPKGKATSVVVDLVGGDRLSGVSANGTDDGLTLLTRSIELVFIPLEYVTRLRFPAADLPAWAEPLQRLERDSTRDDDRLLLVNGDVLRGFLRRVGALDLVLEQNGADVAIPLSTLVAGVLAPTPPPMRDGLRARVSLNDGGKLTATGLDWSSLEAVELTVFGDRRQTVPAKSITTVEVSGGRWVWLAALDPVSEQNTPMTDLAWNSVRNANVLHKPLRVAGQPYESGIGVHSASSLTFDLAGKYREFITSFGLDDAAGPYGDVTVEILVDGQRRHEQADVRRGKLHGPLRLDLRNAKLLQLNVGFGRNGDLQDRFDWIEPALTR